MDQDTFIAVVTYNSGDFIENCISSIISSDNKRWFLAVADNCSEDFTADRIFKYLSDRIKTGPVLDENNFRFIRLKKNIGFAGAVNHLVFDFLIKNNTQLAEKVKYLVLVNPDVVLEKTTLETLVSPFEPGMRERFFSSDMPGAGVVGGLIYDYDRYRYQANSQLSGAGIQNAGGKIRENYITYHLDRQVLFRKFYPVDYTSGSVFATRLDYFKKVSGFDTGYRPLYFEELDYCLKLKKTGLLSYINTEAKARHYEGASVKKFSRNFYRHYHKNRIRCAIINSGVKYFLRKFLPSEARWLKNTASKDQYPAIFMAYFLNFFFLSYNLLIKLKNYIIIKNFYEQVL